MKIDKFLLDIRRHKKKWMERRKKKKKREKLWWWRMKMKLEESQVEKYLWFQNNKSLLKQFVGAVKWSDEGYYLRRSLNFLIQNEKSFFVSLNIISAWPPHRWFSNKFFKNCFFWHYYGHHFMGKCCFFLYDFFLSLFPSHLLSPFI